MRIRILTILSMLAAMACAPDRDAEPRPATVTRDSAGIHIVENARPPEGSRLPWRIGPEPAASIGVLEGEEPYMLHNAMDATKLSDGRIVVANNGTHELRVFDAVGTHVATWGRRGQGPGEFLELWQVERWPGDSIAAWYAPRLGMSVFDADGNYGRTFWLEEVGARFIFGPPATGGSVLAIHNPEGADTLVVQLRDAEGRVRSSFGTHPGNEPFRKTVDGRPALFWTILGRDPVWAPWGDRGRDRSHGPLRDQGLSRGRFAGTDRQTRPCKAGADAGRYRRAHRYEVADLRPVRRGKPTPFGQRCCPGTTTSRWPSTYPRSDRS